VGERHLNLLLQVLVLLDRYSETVTTEQMESDLETWLKVKAALEVATQCTIDLALLLVSRRGLAAPQSYREAFTLLARDGLISVELGSALGRWAGLRNVLVHVYTALDLDRVHDALSDTAPLREFHAIAARELLSNP
jgi:uncharacterized protein YutE (UPF0331/DUF86 family)